MDLAGLRAAVAQTLGGIPQVAAGDWTVLASPPDAVEPPVFVLVWGPDPMLSVQSACTDTAQLEVIAVAARVEVTGTYPLLEAMVTAAVAALVSARFRPWQTLSPAQFEIAQINYLASRLQLRYPVTTGG